ncbi:MAG: hypothetical protein K2I80_07045, partial [Ruminococcus sp.]|nr:hypothetical protein [Ruminococcus sp.]
FLTFCVLSYSNSQEYLTRLKENLETAINMSNLLSAEALAAKMAALQQELLDRTARCENYDDVAEEMKYRSRQRWTMQPKRSIRNAFERYGNLSVLSRVESRGLMKLWSESCCLR